jgi:hypothetical protein
MRWRLAVAVCVAGALAAGYWLGRAHVYAHLTKEYTVGHLVTSWLELDRALEAARLTREGHTVEATTILEGEICLRAGLLMDGWSYRAEVERKYPVVQIDRIVTNLTSYIRDSGSVVLTNRFAKVLFGKFYEGAPSLSPFENSPSRVTSDDTVTPDVYRRWQTQHSFDALVEIIDAHLVPKVHQVSKQDVLTRLGAPNWGTIGQDTNRVWAYQGSGRHMPRQDKVLFGFGTNDVLVTVEWVSE